MYKIEWIKNKNIPKLNDYADETIIPPRPVYYEELDLLGFNEYWNYPKSVEPLLWALGRDYYYNSEKIGKAVGGDINNAPILEIYSNNIELLPINLEELINENREKIEILKNESIDFIKKVHNDYKNKVDFFIVAFSGGKDSQVILDLITIALEPEEYKVIFTDTTMELPQTYGTVRQTEKYYQRTYNNFKITMVRNPTDADELWNVFGPPSRILRWCCSVYKTSPVHDLEQILQSELNLHILTPSEILKKICAETNLYLKWLLKGYAVLEDNGNNYFYEVIESSNLNDVLIEKIWFDIFDEYNPAYISQRYEILIDFYSKDKPSINIETRLRSLLKNDEQLIPILTGITQVEKEYIVNLYALNKVNDDYIKKYYSDLNSYMDNVDFVNSVKWIEDYFIEYKNSKIKNKLSTKLGDILKNKNKNKNSFFNWYADTTLKEVSDFHIDKEKTFWIDGLGIEWLGVIKNYAMNKGYKCDFYLSKSKLPTTTNCNRFEDIKKTEALDRDYIHKQTSYQYPKNLIEEIDIIKDILDNHLDDDLTIVSDHGFSAFCSFQTKINSFNNDEHEGRCAKVDDILDDVNYFSYDFQECGRYLVSLNHTSLNNKTRREAHGGATPEEVIVPIIKIYKSNNERTIIKPKKIDVPVKKGFIEEDLF